MQALADFVEYGSNGSLTLRTCAVWFSPAWFGAAGPSRSWLVLPRVQRGLPQVCCQTSSPGEGRGSGPPTGPHSHPFCSPGVSEWERGSSAKPVRTEGLPGYGHWLSCIFLAFSLTPQNLSAERGSLRPSGERVLCLSSSYSWCLSNLMHPERLLFDPGTEGVCLHVILLVGQGSGDARPGWLCSVGREKTRCPAPELFLQSWSPSLLAFLHLSQFSLVVSCTCSRVYGDAEWGGTRKNTSMPPCSDQKTEQHLFQDISQSDLRFPILSLIPSTYAPYRITDLLNLTDFLAFV